MCVCVCVWGPNVCVRQMRTIAYKGDGGLILAIFVSMYYLDDPL